MLTLLSSAWVTLGNLGLPQLSTCRLPVLCVACGAVVNLARAFPTSSFGPHLPGFRRVRDKGVRMCRRAEDTLGPGFINHGYS